MRLLFNNCRSCEQDKAGDVLEVARRGGGGTAGEVVNNFKRTKAEWGQLGLKIRDSESRFRVAGEGLDSHIEKRLRSQNWK